jgi:hypothetical protein
MRPSYQGHEEGDVPRLPRALPDQKAMPLEELQKMLRGERSIQQHKIRGLTSTEHSIALERTPGTFFSESRPRNVTNRAIGQPPPGLFSPQRREPSFKAPDVDDLSASLGLPGMKNRIPTDDSPASSHKSRLSEGNPEDLFGKLIGRALDKPLTADALAYYMNGKSIPDAPQGGVQGFPRYGSNMRAEDREDGEGQVMKVVRPPPGLGGGPARMIPVEERTAVAPEPQYVPTGPAAFDQGPPRRFSDLSAVGHDPQYFDHARHPSSRRLYRSRAHTRTKRTDQGPEPSHADIYPDDAVPNYMPRRPSYQQEPAGYFGTYIPPPREFQVQDPVSWPTPAEVYTQKQQPESPPRRSVFAQSTAATLGAYAQEQIKGAHAQEQGQTPLHRIFEQYNAIYPPQARTPTPPFDLFADHRRPSTADMNEGDADMEALLNDIPKFFNAEIPDVPDLSCDNRPLTPSQEDGKRYGLHFNGIGLGDPWMCPEAKEGDPFRLRPRNHEGWGGWEWAFKKGWGDE